LKLDDIDVVVMNNDGNSDKLYSNNHSRVYCIILTTYLYFEATGYTYTDRCRTVDWL